ncbi:MAG: hypothetical protein IAE66_02525 [Xanthomonadaceae bacterium]|nr:hypothetical protein [Xanthomonadaceae bacterium]
MTGHKEIGRMERKSWGLAGVLLALSMTGLVENATAQASKPVGNAMQVAGSESVLSMRVDGELLITPEGQAGEYRITTDNVPDEVKSLIDLSIATWRFEPVKDAQGNPVMAKTHMRMTVVARELEEKKYTVNVENVRFHDGTRGGESKASRDRAKEAGIEVVQRPRPNYPAMMLSSGVSGAALVNVLLAPDGSVADAVVVQSAMFNVRGQSALMGKAFGEMEREAVRSVKRMRVRFGEGVDPTDPKVSSGVLMINFEMTGKADQSETRRQAGVWRIEQRGPLRTPSWEIEKAGLRMGISDMDGSEGYVSGGAGIVKPLSGVPVL